MSAFCLASSMAAGGMRTWRRSFFSENEEIMREVFFDTNNLLGVDSEGDVEDAVSVKYEDFVPEMFSEEGQLMRKRIKEISETKIVRLSPVNWESEDEETLERMASPMAVETVSDAADANVATDIDVKNQHCSKIAAKSDRVEKIVTVRVELPSVPGPFSEDVSMNDFVPRTRLGPVLFLTFREPASGEVSVCFLSFI